MQRAQYWEWKGRGRNGRVRMHSLTCNRRTQTVTCAAISMRLQPNRAQRGTRKCLARMALG